MNLDKMNIDIKAILYVCLILIVTAVVTTVIFFSINKQPNFQNKMKQAGRMMATGLRNNNTAGSATGTCPLTGAPRIGGGGGLGLGGQQAALQQQRPQQGNFISGGQYICSQCGHTGLPTFGVDSKAHCTACGSSMNINRLTAAQAQNICTNNNCPTVR